MLANTDSKTLFRILVTRLSPGMSSIIHLDQAGFIPGRNIVNTALNVKILLLEGELSLQSFEAALVMLDQQKAYDRVHHIYLIECLLKFSFLLEFAEVIYRLYSNLEDAVQFDRHTTAPFYLQCGVR